MNVVFWVEGNPAPQGSKRHVGNGVLIESSKNVGAWRDTIAWKARSAMGALPTFNDGVQVDLAFLLPRPQRTPQSTPPAVKRPDIDKLTRAVLDALTGICFRDDSQVTHLSATKHIAEPWQSAGVEITLRDQGGAG